MFNIAHNGNPLEAGSEASCLARNPHYFASSRFDRLVPRSRCSAS